MLLRDLVIEALTVAVDELIVTPVIAVADISVCLICVPLEIWAIGETPNEPAVPMILKV